MDSDRRTRIDSNSERVRIISGSTRIINPPDSVSLNSEEVNYFNNIINEFPKADWTAHQIELVALLARMIADFKRESELLRKEGGVVTGGAGGAVVNPRKQVVQMHSNNIVAFRRSLALHAASQAQKHDTAKRVKIGHQIQAEAAFDDDLIARPN